MLRVDRDKLPHDELVGVPNRWPPANAAHRAVNEIFRLWANNYRFVSEERLRSHLMKTTGYRKIKGDYLKEQARRFLNSAQKFIDKGAMMWQA